MSYHLTGKRRSTGLKLTSSTGLIMCRYTIVFIILEWPSSSFSLYMLTPISKRWVAYVCRKIWGVKCYGVPGMHWPSGEILPALWRSFSPVGSGAIQAGVFQRIVRLPTFTKHIEVRGRRLALATTALRSPPMHPEARLKGESLDFRRKARVSRRAGVIDGRLLSIRLRSEEDECLIYEKTHS